MNRLMFLGIGIVSGWVLFNYFHTCDIPDPGGKEEYYEEMIDSLLYQNEQLEVEREDYRIAFEESLIREDSLIEVKDKIVERYESEKVDISAYTPEEHIELFAGYTEGR